MKRIFCFLLAIILLSSLIPQTRATEEIINEIDFSGSYNGAYAVDYEEHTFLVKNQFLFLCDYSTGKVESTGISASSVTICGDYLLASEGTRINVFRLNDLSFCGFWETSYRVDMFCIQDYYIYYVSSGSVYKQALSLEEETICIYQGEDACFVYCYKPYLIGYILSTEDTDTTREEEISQDYANVVFEESSFIYSTLDQTIEGRNEYEQNSLINKRGAYGTSSSYSTVVGSTVLPLPEYPAGSYATTNGAACSNHNRCLRYYTDPAGKTVDTRGWQCCGFARYAFYRCFGFVDWAGCGSFYEAVSNVSTGSITVNYLKSILGKSVLPGAHIRTKTGVNGYAHSLVFLGCDDSYVYTYECNAEGKCKVGNYKRTWSEMATYLTSVKYGIHFIDMPTNYPVANPPAKPGLSIAKTTYSAGEPVTVSWNAVENNSYFWINVYKDGTLIVDKNMGQNTGYTLSAPSAGSYSVHVSANNSAGTSGSSICYFTVIDNPPTLTANVSSVCLYLDGTNTKTVTLTTGGYLPYNLSVGGQYTSEVIAASFESFSGNTIKLTMTGKTIGDGYVTVNLLDDDTQTVLASARINVYVTGPTYTVSYNANGGTGAPSQQIKTYGQNLVLSNSIPEGQTFSVTLNPNGGYVDKNTVSVSQEFSHWSTAQDNSGDRYDAGESYSTEASVVLYAQYDSAELGALTHPTRDGYYFLGWYDSIATDEYGVPLGKLYSEVTPVKEDIELFALWSKSSILLWGDYNRDGIVDNTDVEGISKRLVGLEENADNNAVFYGDLDADGIVGNIDCLMLVRFTAGIITQEQIHAYQLFEGFTIGTYPQTSYEYGEALDTTGLTLIANYSNGTTHELDEGFFISGYDPYKIGNQTITVSFYQYTLTYTVTVNNPQYLLSFDANGGDVSTTQITVTYNSAIGSLPTPARNGYTFLGWSYSQDGSSCLNATDKYLYFENKTVYAQWQEGCAPGAHNYVHTESAADCTTRGFTFHVCLYCADSYKDSYTAALGHSSMYFDNGDGTHDYICSVCGIAEAEDEIHSYAGGVCSCGAFGVSDPEEVTVKIGHTVSFDSDLRMNYRVKYTDLAAAVPNYVTEGAYLTVEKDRYSTSGELSTEVITIEADILSDSSRMIFTLSGIQSVEMGSELRAILHFFDSEGQEYMTQVDTYSVLAYAELCFDTYTYEAQPELLTMLIDALNYGSAAQVYFGRRADELVNAGMDAYRQYATTGLSAALDDVKTTVENERTITAVTKMGFSVTFADKTEMNAKLTIADGYSKEDITCVKVLDAAGNVVDTLTDFTELSDGRLQVTYYGVKSIQMRDMFYFVAYVGDQIASDNIGYSVEAYAKSNVGSTNAALAEMALQCIYYGDSAYAYFNR